MECTLKHIDGLSGTAQAVLGKEKCGHKPKVAAAVALNGRGRPHASGALPFTVDDFWQLIVTTALQAARDVLVAAEKSWTSSQIAIKSRS